MIGNRYVASDRPRDGESSVENVPRRLCITPNSQLNGFRLPTQACDFTRYSYSSLMQHPEISCARPIAMVSRFLVRFQIIHSSKQFSNVKRQMSLVGLEMVFGQTDSLSGRSIDSNRFSNVDIVEACMEASRDAKVDIPPFSPSCSAQCLLSIFSTFVQDAQHLFHLCLGPVAGFSSGQQCITR